MSDYQKLKELYKKEHKELIRIKHLLKMAFKREESMTRKLQKLQAEIETLGKELEEYKILLCVKTDNMNNIKDNIWNF